MFKVKEIIDFFVYLSEVVDKYVTAIEVKPVRIKEDLYITGFKRKGLGLVEAHLKEIKSVALKSNDYSIDLPLKGDPEHEMWVDCEVLNETTLRMAYNDIKAHYFTLKSFDVAELKYRLKTPNSSDYIMCEEVIIYDNKTQACKDTILKRKHNDGFSVKFHHFGETLPVTKKVTDLEFAESEI